MKFRIYKKKNSYSKLPRSTNKIDSIFVSLVNKSYFCIGELAVIRVMKFALVQKTPPRCITPWSKTRHANWGRRSIPLSVCFSFFLHPRHILLLYQWLIRTQSTDTIFYPDCFWSIFRDTYTYRQFDSSKILNLMLHQ